MSDEPQVPSIEDANRELMFLTVQTMPQKLRAAFLEGVIAARQDEAAKAPKKRPARS